MGNNSFNNEVEFEGDKIWTPHAQNIDNRTDIIRINIEIEGVKRNSDELTKCIIFASYSSSETMKNIMNEIEKYLNKKYYPAQYKLGEFIGNKSFTKESIYRDETDKINNKSMINYKKKNIINKGLRVWVAPHYEHDVTCQYMKQLNTFDRSKCPIYYAMKENKEYTQKNLDHLHKFKHFNDEYGEKPECKFNDNCNALHRLEKGGNKLEDHCHLKLYHHQPTQRFTQLSKNMHSLIINTDWEQNYKLYEPTNDDKIKYNWSRLDGYLWALTQEVINNKYHMDLCGLPPYHHSNDDDPDQPDECHHDVQNNLKYDADKTILPIINKYMNHYRHKAMNSPLNRGEMLSLILYTGCDCNYDLCKSQRNNDYKKWIWFDYCLNEAIRKISYCESGSYSVYSGLSEVKLDKKEIPVGYFKTYTSTTWSKDVAQEFIGKNKTGMLIEIGREYKQWKMVSCCDVSWISKFPDECEVVFARTLDWSCHQFKCVATMDESNGIQTVSITCS